MNQNSCKAITAHVLKSKEEQIASASEHKTNDRNHQRSECWRFGVVGLHLLLKDDCLKSRTRLACLAITTARVRRLACVS